MMIGDNYSVQQKQQLDALLRIETKAGAIPRSVEKLLHCGKESSPALTRATALSSLSNIMARLTRHPLQTLRLNILQNPYHQDLLTKDFVNWIKYLQSRYLLNPQIASSIVIPLQNYFRDSYNGGPILEGLFTNKSSAEVIDSYYKSLTPSDDSIKTRFLTLARENFTEEVVASMLWSAQDVKPSTDAQGAFSTHYWREDQTTWPGPSHIGW